MSCIKDPFYGDADCCNKATSLEFEHLAKEKLLERRSKEMKKLEEVQALSADQIILKEQLIETQRAIDDSEDGIRSLTEALGVMTLPSYAEEQMLAAIDKARNGLRRLYDIKNCGYVVFKHGVDVAIEFLGIGDFKNEEKKHLSEIIEKYEHIEQRPKFQDRI